MKINMRVAKIELKVEKECNGHCHKMKPLTDFGINPRTGDLYATCKVCRAYLRSKPRIGRLALDWDGLTWKVDAYTNHPEYPYMLRRYAKGEMVAQWLTDEATVKTCLERARKEPQRVHSQD